MSIASLYPSINPSLLLDFANSKVLDSRVTFTRTTTATYYDGVTTAKAEENLLTYSQEFDNAAWSKADAAVTANATTAPDGTSTADSMIPSATNAEHNIGQSINYSSGSIIGSIYAKANGYNYLQINSGFDTSYVNFDITSGSASVTATSGANISGSIQDAGNGWYRCIVTYTPSLTGSQLLRFNIVNSGTAARRAAFLANGTSGVYLWGAQLEQRSSVTAYTATTTQAITNYIPVLQTAAAGRARFDHNPTTGESLGLLIEEARTNACLQSEDFNTGWTLANSTVSTNATIAPNGTLTADKITPSSTGSYRGLYRTFTASGATTVSVYAKYGGYQWFFLAKPDGSNIGVSFDILNGVKGTEQSGVTGTITSVGNGWYRCTCTQTLTGTAYVQIDLASADNTNSVTVAANDVFSGVFLWGAQAETSGSSFATSYIPTTGSTATRNADAASMTGTNFSSWFNNGEGTIYSEAITGPNSTSTDSDGDSIGVLCISDGTNNNRIRHAVSITTLDIRYSGSQVVSISSGTYVSRTAYRSASAYKTNDFQFSNNGTLGTADTSGNVPPATTMQIGASGITSDAGSLASGSIKKIAYYPIRVTNTQLQSLTV